MNFKSELAPKGLQFNPSDFVISDRYATILTVVSYPRLIGPGYLSNLTNMSGVKVVIKHIPLPFSVLAKMLNKEIADLKSKYQQEKDRTIQERIRQDVDSLEYFIQQFTASQARTFDFQMHIMITANSEEEFQSYMKEMEALSLYDTGVKAGYGDHLLTLSTCDYEEKDGRFVVVAKRVK